MARLILDTGVLIAGARGRVDLSGAASARRLGLVKTQFCQVVSSLRRRLRQASKVLRSR